MLGCLVLVIVSQIKLNFYGFFKISFFMFNPESDFEHLNETDVAIFNDMSMENIPVLYVNGCSHACK